MHQRLKERLVGAAVLVFIAVVFIPMLLTGPIDSGSITKTNIPDRPTEKFNSKLVPLNDSLEPITVVDSEDEIEEPDIESVEKLPEITPVNEDKTVKQNVTPQENKVKEKQVGLTAWVVQLGSFTSKVNADKLNLELRKSKFPSFVEPIKQNGETAYRVRVGPEILRSDADALLKKIKTKMKLDGIVLSYP
jgi:DedD protein